MRASRSTRVCESISAILTAHGNAAPTRTLTDCCASTSPKGPISAYTANEIAAVAAALNSRPRKTLDWKTAAEALDRFVLSADKDRVATTA